MVHLIPVESFGTMGTFESVRLRQVCGSAEDCNLGTSCSSTAEMSFEARIKLLRTPWDEWNRAFQVLVDQHVQKVEQISTRFDALVKRTEIVADQVAAWGNLQPEPVRPGTTHTADGAPDETTVSLGSSASTLDNGWMRQRFQLKTGKRGRRDLQTRQNLGRARVSVRLAKTSRRLVTMCDMGEIGTVQFARSRQKLKVEPSTFRWNGAMADGCTECGRNQDDSFWTVGSLGADLCADKVQRTVETMTGVLAAQTGGLAKMGASVAEVTDGATEVTHLDKTVAGAVTDIDKDVSPWRSVGLCRSQETKLSDDGLQPWANSGSLTAVRREFACVQPVVDTGQIHDRAVGGGAGGHLPTV